MFNTKYDMADLISLERAKEQIPNIQGCDDGILSAYITASSQVIEAYCRRIFTQQSYDSLVHGTGTEFLYLDNPPVTRVAVRTSLLGAVWINYSNAGSQTQTANVEVSSTGVTLTKTFNNVTTTNTFLFADYPTFGVLVPAINLVGHNWSCTLNPQFQYWQTSDLARNQFGIYSAKNCTVPLSCYWLGLANFRMNEDIGELYNAGGWARGYEAYRVTYTGGFDPIPEDLQHCCAALVQLCYLSRNANPLMNSETLDKYSYTKAANMNLKNLDAAAQATLNKYKILSVARYKV